MTTAQAGGPQDKVSALLEDARFCCHRAQHDAIDAAMSKIGIDLDDLTSKLGFEAVLEAYPDFREFFAEFSIARGKIAASRKKRLDRNSIYESITAVDLPNLIGRYERLMAVRPLAKHSALRRRLSSASGVAILILTLIGVFFAGLAVDWPKVRGWFAPVSITSVESPAQAPKKNDLRK